MKQGTLKADSLLLFTAAIWGFAFVAQRAGMEHIGPYLFNGIRFALGSLSLVPLILIGIGSGTGNGILPEPVSPRGMLLGSGIAGLILFAGASLQQMGIVYTTAGKAGFITGLYVILVPIVGLRWGHRASAGTWIGAILATAGLYFLSVTSKLTIERGDLLVLLSAFMWAAHVLWISWFSPRMNPVLLASVQFAICSVASLLTAFVLEPVSLAAIRMAALPILYGGLFSVGIAYTLQVVAQRDAHPAHASIILSMEGAFAIFGGWLILSETMGLRELAGCALMLSGMVLSQLWTYRNHGRTGKHPEHRT
ncbi:MAG: DMT family transporter [bacterium]|nr:DMT family transporter [bacterium]MDT8395716.1 DMT family transporter [bacterium]